MVCRKGEQAIDERKSTRRCQGFIETKRFETSTCKMDRGNVWVSKAAKSVVRGFEKAGILEAVKMAQEEYARCENPFDEKQSLFFYYYL